MQNSRNVKETAQALLNNQFIFGLYIWGSVRHLRALLKTFIGWGQVILKSVFKWK